MYEVSPNALQSRAVFSPTGQPRDLCSQADSNSLVGWVLKFQVKISVRFLFWSPEDPAIDLYVVILLGDACVTGSCRVLFHHALIGKKHSSELLQRGKLFSSVFCARY